MDAAGGGLTAAAARKGKDDAPDADVLHVWTQARSQSLPDAERLPESNGTAVSFSFHSRRCRRRGAARTFRERPATGPA